MKKNLRISLFVYYLCKFDKLNISDNFICMILVKRDYVVVINNVIKYVVYKGLNIEK